MSRTTITTADESYLVSADDSVPPEGRFRAFVVGQALDAVTHQPLTVPVRIAVQEAGFVTQIKEDNWFVIAGILRLQFPLLATQASTIHLTLSASGYQPLPVIAQVPQTAAGSLPAVVELNPASTEMVPEP